MICLISGCSDNTQDSLSSSVPEYTLIDFEPAWSGSGNKIAYAHSNVNNDFTGIYIINSDGSNNRQLLNAFASSPDWSADEEWIVFAINNSIQKIKTNGDSLMTLTDGGINSNPKWSSDGSRIAYCDCGNLPCRVVIIKPDGSLKTIIDTNAVYPDWVNGSSSLIYFKPVKNNEGLQTGDTLIQYFLSSGEKKIISVLNDDNHRVNTFPVFADDAIIFCSMNKEGGIYIYRMNTDGSSIVKLTDSQGYAPDYSASLQKIVYTNRNKGNGRLWLMDKNGNGKVQFTH